MQTAGSMLPEEFESWNRTEQVKYISETWLEREGAMSSDETRSGKEIVEGTKAMFPNLDIPESSVFQYLSALVRNPDSRINTAQVIISEYNAVLFDNESVGCATNIISNE